MDKPIICEDPITIGEIKDKSSNFIYGFRPIYYFSRVFGLMPFTIHYDTSGVPKELKIRFIDWIIFLILIIVCLTMTEDSHLNMTVPVGQQFSIITVLVRRFIHLSAIISSAVIIVLEMYNRHKSIRILTSFTTFDKNVSVQSNSICFLFQIFHS